MTSVDVALPVFNGDRYIRQTIESLLAQTHDDLRVQVTDNASTDRTREVVHDLIAKDARVSYRCNAQNLGGIANFNLGMEATTAPFVMWASAHDLYEPGYVRACLDELQSRPQAVLCYTGARWIDPDGVEVSVLAPTLDTRGLAPLARLNSTIWGFGYNNYAIYGLMRRDLLTRLRRWPAPYPPTLAPDHVMLGELALVGEVLLHPEVLFSLRRMGDFGDFGAYVEKIKTGAQSRREAVSTYWRLVTAMGSLTRGQELPAPQRTVAAVSGVAAGTFNYLGMARALWRQGSASGRRNEDGSQGRAN